MSVTSQFTNTQLAGAKRKAEYDLFGPELKKAKTEESTSSVAQVAITAAQEQYHRRQQLLSSIEKYPNAYKTFPEADRMSRLFNVEVCSRNGLCLQYMSPVERNNFDVCMSAIINNPKSIAHVYFPMAKGFELWMEALAQDKSVIKWIPKEYLRKFEHLKTLIELVGVKVLKMTAKDVRADKDLMNPLFGHFGEEVIQYADKDLKNDRKFFEQLVQFDVDVLKYAADTLVDHEKLMLKALETSEKAFDYASKRLQETKSFIMAALDKGNISSSIAPKFKKDEDILKKIVNWDAEAFTKFSKAKQNDRKFAFSMLEVNPVVYHFLSQVFKEDKQFCLHILHYDYFINNAGPLSAKAIELVPLKWRSDLEFMTQAFEIDQSTLKYASDSVKQDKKLIKKACKESAYYITYAHPKLLEDCEFFKELLLIDLDCIEHAPEIFFKDLTHVKDILKVKPELLEKLPDSVREKI